MLGWQGTVQRWLQQDTGDTSEAQLMSALQTARRALIEEQANSKAQARAQAEEVDALRLQLDLVRQELQAACERVRLLSESERDKGSTAREMQLHHAVVRWTGRRLLCAFNGWQVLSSNLPSSLLSNHPSSLLSNLPSNLRSNLSFHLS